jgi:tetratricopeptide (TPR) repeat protein
LRVSVNAFKEAESFLEHTQRPTLRAALLECYAALRLRQMRLSETRAALIEALEIREQVGEPGAIAATLNQLGLSESESGNHVDAVQYLSRANRLITWERDPRMFLLSRHNSILALRAMGRSVDALNLYERLQPIYATTADKVQRLRGQWLFAKIAASFGRGSSDVTAERAFRDTARTAIELDLPYESGKVLFELGEFFASRRRWHQLELVMVEALNLLDYLGISRDSALARILLLVGRDRARSQALLHRAGRLLSRHQFATAA